MHIAHLSGMRVEAGASGMTCCPTSGRASASTPTVSFRAAGLDTTSRVAFPLGRVQVGTSDRIHPGDGESPPRSVRVKPFSMDICAVTNARFARFMAETRYVTDAQRYGWSYVFFGLLADPDAHTALPGLDWWRRVEGARWDRPEGAGSTLDDRMDHPVTHVSWNDATAFATWAGGRLPTEAEWECAAQGTLGHVRYPWGQREPDDTGFFPCNIWQGTFPHSNTGGDGYVATAPARSYAPNKAGLYNMVGNTWEWTADQFRIRSPSKAARQANDAARRSGARVVKGGSFLCHRTYCYRYRIAARSSNTPDTTLSHTGFRLAYDAVS